MKFIASALCWFLGITYIGLALIVNKLAPALIFLLAAGFLIPVTRELIRRHLQVDIRARYWIPVTILLTILGISQLPHAPPGSTPASSRYTAPISPDAFWDYNRKSFPKLYKKYGTEGLARLNSFERRAAELVSRNKKCNEITMVGYSEQSTKDNFVSFIDCKNGERFFVTEQEVFMGHLKSQSEKSISHTAAIAACKSGVMAQLRFPSEASFSIFNTDVETFRANGNVRVTLDFKAMNGLGNRLPQRAVCLFSPGGKGEIDIFNR